MTKIHQQQNYVLELAGDQAKLVEHSLATSTCKEKLELLLQTHPQTHWELSDMIKALYFKANGTYVGIITPESGITIPSKQIIQETLKISIKKAKRYRLNGTPTGMESGTCTPFPYQHLVGTEISDLIILAHPKPQNLTDISVGGTEPEAHKLSMHIPYELITQILTQKFGSKVHTLEQVIA